MSEEGLHDDECRCDQCMDEAFGQLPERCGECGKAQPDCECGPSNDNWLDCWPEPPMQYLDKDNLGRGCQR